MSNLHIILFAQLVVCNSISVLAIKNCAHPWKKDLGLKINSTSKFDLLGLYNMIGGFLHNLTIGDETKTSFQRCSESPDCKLSIKVDKRRNNSIIVCVMTDDTEACFTSTCQCPGRRQKRGINTDTYVDNDKGYFLNRLQANCTLQFLRNVSDGFGKFEGEACKNDMKEQTSNKLSKNLETSTAKGENKDDVTGFYLMSFFIGALIGLFLGAFAMYVYLKRKSKKPRTLSVRNEIYHTKKDADAEITFNETTEYSEIPEVLGSSKADDETPREEGIATGEPSVKPSQIRPSAILHTSPSLLVHIDMHEEAYRESGRGNAPSTAEYVEPLSDMYFKLNSVSTDKGPREQIEESGLYTDMEGNTCDEKVALEKLSVPTDKECDTNTNVYHQLKDCSNVDRSPLLSKERRTYENCKSTEDKESNSPTYFVLKTSQPVATKDSSDVSMLVKECPQSGPISGGDGSLTTFYEEVWREKTTDYAN